MSPKVWFITGASSGFGRTVTEHVLQKGDIAVATMRKPEVLNDLASAYDSSRLLCLKLDVTKTEDITNAFNKAKDAFGGVDVVYSNAGWGAVGETEGTPDDVARALFEANFWGAANVARAAVKFFREVNGPNIGGTLLQVSSMVEFESIPGVGYYSASKHAIGGLIEALSKEVLPSWNIRISIIAPGGFETRGTKPESIVILDEHPAYKGGITTTVKQGIQTSKLPGDPQKAAQAIYDIANVEGSIPLHLPLGLDAVEAVKRQAEAYKSDALKSEKWSKDLEF